MKFEDKQIEAIKMDIRRLVRLHGRDGLDEKVAEYVMENCQPISEDIEPPNVQTENQGIAIDRVMSIITEHFGLSLKQLSTKSRKRELCYPRQAAMYLLSVKSHLPLRVIGEMFGGRDHTTAIHSRDAILDKISKSFHVKSEIGYLLKKVS